MLARRDGWATPEVSFDEPSHNGLTTMPIVSFADASWATDWGAIFAMSALSLAPVFVVFIVFQRYLVQGISTTGMKG